MPNTDMNNLAGRVGQAIAKQRSRSGLTQEEVAERLGVGNEAVSRIERGIVTPKIERLLELAGIFDCTAAELLTEVSPRPDDQATRISRLLMKLDQQDRQFIVALVERLAERLKKG